MSHNILGAPNASLLLGALRGFLTVVVYIYKDVGDNSPTAYDLTLTVSKRELDVGPFSLVYEVPFSSELEDPGVNEVQSSFSFSTFVSELTDRTEKTRLIYTGFEYKIEALVEFTPSTYSPPIRAFGYMVYPPKLPPQISIVPGTFLKIKITLENSATNRFDQLDIHYRNQPNGAVLKKWLSFHQLQLATLHNFSDITRSQFLEVFASCRDVKSFDSKQLEFNNTIPTITITKDRWNEDRKLLSLEYAASRGDMKTVTIKLSDVYYSLLSTTYTTDYTSLQTVEIPYDVFTEAGIYAGRINLTATLSYDDFRSFESPLCLSSIPPLAPNTINYSYEEVLSLTWRAPSRDYDYSVVNCTAYCFPPLMKRIESGGLEEGIHYNTKTGVGVIIEIYTVIQDIKSRKFVKQIIISVSNLISQSVKFSQIERGVSVKDAKVVLTMEAYSKEKSSFDFVEVKAYHLFEEEYYLLFNISFSSERFQPSPISASPYNTSSRSLSETVSFNKYSLDKDHPILGETYTFRFQVRGLTDGDIVEQNITADRTTFSSSSTVAIVIPLLMGAAVILVFGLGV